MDQVIKSKTANIFDGQCAVNVQPLLAGAGCGIDLSTVMDIDPTDCNGDIGTVDPIVESEEPLQDWFEMAIKVESPTKRGPTRASWGEDEDEIEEEPIKEDSEDEEPDPFEDFDEDDFDDDFDDDFEEELDDEYEIEPADDGLVTDPDADLGNADILDEDEEVGPDVEDPE